MEQVAYDAYGHHARSNGVHRVAYVGEVREPDLGWYILGTRVYDPTTRRFLSPDHASPFDAGGMNRHAYCGGDPIGRSDPDGHSWFSWLASTLDRIDLPLTTVGSSSGSQSTFATPTLLTTAVSRPESTQLWSAIKRNAPSGELMGALRAYGNARLPMDGPNSQQTRLFSVTQNTPGIQWPRKGDTASATVFTPDRRTIQVITGPHAFSNDPVRARRAARGIVYPHWIERTNANGGVQFAATTTINPNYMHSLKNYIGAQYPGRDVTIFAGAHGQQAGRFWDDDGKRAHLEQKFFDSVQKKVRQLQWPVSVIDYADIDADRMRARMTSGKGVDVHFTCFGATDPMFMQVFNIVDMTSRALTPVPLPTDPAP